MEYLEQENQELREGMTAMRTEVEKLTALVSTLMATQNQVCQNTDTVLEPVTSAIPSSTVITSISHAIIPEGFSWGMPHGFNEDPCPFGSTSTTKPMPSGGYPWGMPHEFNGDPRPFRSTSTTKPMPSSGYPW